MINTIEFYTDAFDRYILYIKNKYYICYSNSVFNLLVSLRPSDKKVEYFIKEFNPTHIKTIYRLLYWRKNACQSNVSK